MNKYSESTLSFFVEWYTDCYTTGAFSFWYLKDKLALLESVEPEWTNHRDYRSYYASVDALKIVIDRIDKEEIQECQNI